MNGPVIRTGSAIGRLGLRDATVDALERNGIRCIADLLKFLRDRRLTELSRVGCSREAEILGALQAVGVDLSYVTGAAAVLGGYDAAPPEPGG